MDSTLGAAACAAKVTSQKEGQIAGELDHMNGAVNKLSLLVERLEDRLSLVVTCVPPCPDNDPVPVPVDVMVPMADTVRTLRRSVDSVGERVNSLVNRIEL